MPHAFQYCSPTRKFSSTILTSIPELPHSPPLLLSPRTTTKNMEFLTLFLSFGSLVTFVLLISMVVPNNTISQTHHESPVSHMANRSYHHNHAPIAESNSHQEVSQVDDALLLKTSTKGSEEKESRRGQPIRNYQSTIDSCLKPHPYFRGLLLELQQNKDNHKDRPPLPKPIINVGFPKAGTTSLWKYFECGRRSYAKTSTNSSSIQLSNMTHDKCDTNYDWKTHDRLDCGFCIRDAISKGLPPLRTCGNFDAYFQLDVEKFHDCSFPQVEYLQQIHNEHPNATFVMTMRDTKHWYQSLVRFRKYNERIGQCTRMNMTTLYPNYDQEDNNKTGSEGREGDGSSYEELKSFYCRQVEHVRAFVQQHPSHALVEIDAEDSQETPKYLESVFGIQQSCWGNKNKNTKKKSVKVKSSPSASSSVQK